MHREFDARQRPRNFEHKDNFDLGHGVCQALTGSKLHKTKDQGHLPVSPKRARVKRIGPGMSEVSDVMTVQAAFYH